MQTLYNNRAVTILIFSGLPLFDSYGPAIYIESGEKSQSYPLTIQINYLIIIIFGLYIVSNLQVSHWYLQQFLFGFKTLLV